MCSFERAQNIHSKFYVPYVEFIEVTLCHFEALYVTEGDGGFWTSSKSFLDIGRHITILPLRPHICGCLDDRLQEQ